MLKKIWDMPTRLFHWVLVVLIANAYLTYEFGDADMLYHMWNGYALLTLVTYRILWGFVGSSTARFTDFIKSPLAIVKYMKSMHGSNAQKFSGHNPVGGLMVLTLLAFILTQGILGLFTTDDIIVEGPLVYLAPYDWVETASSLHRQIYYILLGFIAVHVAAVIFYLLIKKENLIWPMVIGKKETRHIPEGSEVKFVSPIIALICLVIASGFIWLVVNL